MLDKYTVRCFIIAGMATLWAVVSIKLDILTWVGFIGCASYFASKGGKGGLRDSVIANITGVIWAMVMLNLPSRFDSQYSYIIITAIASFFMVYQAKIKSLAFTPGTFCGSCCIFATGGDWRGVILALLLGAFIGYMADWVSNYMGNILEKKGFIKMESPNI